MFKNTKPQIKMETIPCMPNFQMGLLCWKGLLITLPKMIFTNKCEAKKCWETKIKKRNMQISQTVGVHVISVPTEISQLQKQHSLLLAVSTQSLLPLRDPLGSFLEGDSLIPNEVDFYCHLNNCFLKRPITYN